MAQGPNGTLDVMRDQQALIQVDGCVRWIRTDSEGTRMRDHAHQSLSIGTRKSHNGTKGKMYRYSYRD